MTPALEIIDLEVTNENNRFSPVGEMAAVIIEVMRSKGHCLPHDLLSRGFTLAEVSQHGDLARCLATIEVRLMGAAHA